MPGCYHALTFAWANEQPGNGTELGPSDAEIRLLIPSGIFQQICCCSIKKAKPTNLQHRWSAGSLVWLMRLLGDVSRRSTRSVLRMDRLCCRGKHQRFGFSPNAVQLEINGFNRSSQRGSDELANDARVRVVTRPLGVRLVAV